MEHRWDGKKEFRLGRTLGEAYKAWAARLAGDTEPLADMNRVFDRYLLDVLPEKAPSTQRDNRHSIERLRPTFGAMTPAGIKPAHAYKYFDLCSKERGKTTAKHDVQVLRHSLTKCVEWGEMDANPLLGQVRLKGTTGARTRYVEDREITEAVSIRDRTDLKKDGTPRKPSRGVLVCSLYAEFKYAVSQRRTDILRLTLPNIRDDGIHFLPSKTANSTGKGVIVKWDKEGTLRALVDQILAIPPRRIGAAHLFVTREGKPYISENGTANGFDSIWQRYMDKVEKLGVERFQGRDIRAKAATDSATLEEAAERLAHSSTETTKRIYRRKPAKVVALKLGEKEGGD